MEEDSSVVRSLDDLLIILEYAEHDLRRSEKVKRQRVDRFERESPYGSSGLPFTDEQSRLCDNLARLSMRLMTEAKLTSKAFKKRSLGLSSLFSSHNEKDDDDSSSLVYFRLASLAAAQKKTLLNGPIDPSGDEHRNKQLRRLFSDPTSGSFRPFCDLLRLQQLAAPHCRDRNLLLPGDILHVPFTEEECEILRVQLSERPRANYRERILKAVERLPGRTLNDVERFLEHVPTFMEQRDHVLIRKLVVFDKAFSRTLEYDSSHGLMGMLDARAMQNASYAIPGSHYQRFKTDSVLQRLSSLVLHDFGNTAHFAQVMACPTDTKFSPPCAKYRSVVFGSSQSRPYAMKMYRLDACSDPSEAEVIEIYGHGIHAVTEIHWSAAGDCVISSGYDKYVRIWDAETGDQRTSLQLRNACFGVTVGRKKDSLVVCRAMDSRWSNGQMVLWDFKTNVWHDFQASTDFLGHVEEMSFGHDDQVLVCATDAGLDHSVGEAIAWDCTTQKMIARVRPHQGGIQCVDVAPSQSSVIFATGGADERISITDLRDGKKPSVVYLPCYSDLNKKNFVNEFNAVSFSPCGTLVQGASTDNSAVVYDLRGKSHVPLCRLKHRFPSSGYQGMEELESDVLQGAYRATWCTGGRCILVTGGEDGAARVWDLTRHETDANVNTLRGHSRCVSALGVCHEGSAIVTGGDDCRVTLYTLPGSNFRFGTRSKRGANPNPNAHRPNREEEDVEALRENE